MRSAGLFALAMTGVIAGTALLSGLAIALSGLRSVVVLAGIIP